MKARIFKIVGASILTIAVIWALVLGWWQSSEYQPTTTELVLYLGILPFALIGGFWLLYGFIEHIKNPPPPPQAKAETSADVDPLASASAKTAAAERTFTLNLIGAFAVAGTGNSISEILDTVAAGQRPRPDTELKDDDGFPVFCARNEQLDLDELRQRLQDHDEHGPPELRQDEYLRTLALVDATLPGAVAEAAERMAEALPEARLRVLWLLPADWKPELTQPLLAWLRHEYFAALEKSRLELSARPVASDVDALGEIDELILAIRREELEGDLHLVIAANSAVGESSVQAWSSSNSLFTARRQTGRIPGEGAACLLFAARESDASGSPFEGSVRVSRVSRAERDKSVDAGGRISSSLIEQLIDGIMTIRGVDPAAVKMVVADTDHRESRASELLRAVGEKFKELDPMESCLQIGTACGTNTPVGGLLALAGAREKALSEEGPVLCVSNQHPTARAVLLVEYPSPIQATEAASS
jgi:hypothetical protein